MLGIFIVYEVMEAVLEKKSLKNVLMFELNNGSILKIVLILIWVSKVINESFNFVLLGFYAL